MTVENIVYKVNSTDILPGIAVCNRSLNGFYNFKDIIKGFEKRYPIKGGDKYVSLYHIIALLPAIIPNYQGEFINLFSFSCMGYRGQPDKIDRVIKMRAFPAPYSTFRPFTNFGKRGTSTVIFKQWVKYLEQTFKV